MNLLNTPWASALSMTLIHSLWQGFVIVLFISLFFKVAAIRNSSIKYLITTGGFFMLFISSIITFFFLYEPETVSSPIVFQTLANQSKTQNIDSAISYLKQTIDFLQANKAWVILGWAAGAFLFSLRFAAGIVYVKYLRIQALPAEIRWNQLLARLCDQLGIRRIIQLSESIQVHAPIVIGYLKPVVLMPIGLLSGLNVQQIEIILIHELEHIRSHDYLINFLQSLGETLFFFNPFVWILSSWIRTEREHCCDDAVLREGYDPKLYATTLYELESSRLKGTQLALALTGNKNQLLNRIKRIMEHSAKNHKGKEKFIPVLLLVLGLVFASWLSINPAEVTHKATDNLQLQPKTVVDTTKDKKPTSYYRKSTTFNENNEVIEEIIEGFDGDEELHEPFRMDLEIPEIPEIPELDFTIPPLAFSFDTLPGMHNLEFNFQNQEQLKEFEETLKLNFQNFHMNQFEIDKLMKDVDEKMARLNPILSNLNELPAIPNITEDQLMKLLDGKLRILDNQFYEKESDLKEMEENFQLLEKEIKLQLIKDGYLKEGEELNTINFSDHDLKVNGKPIKDSDLQKYFDLKKKYGKRRYYRSE
jgi:bla regulator protein blaR1